jgi:aminoglycoside phosphotransferase (APT) family kinase protein
MQSCTKVPLSLAEIRILVDHDFGTGTEIAGTSELGDGWFNMAYAVSLKNPDKQVVLKVAPPSSIPVLTYESRCMKMEIEAIEFFTQNGQIPVPKLLKYSLEPEHNPIKRKYFWMEKFQGQQLNHASRRMDKQTFIAVFGQLVEYQKKMNAFKGEYFGMYGIPLGGEKRFATWFDAFQSLMDDIISDYARFHVQPPTKLIECHQLLDRFRPYFDEVKEPKFVHWDLWEGNAFVWKNGENYEFEGITDFERALWGDPLMEILFFVSQRKKLFIQQYDPSILDSFTAQVRRLFYNIYFAAIIYLECTARAYPKVKAVFIKLWAKNILKKAYKYLSKKA